MRNFISVFAVAAFVLATMATPSVSYAMPHDSAKAAKTETAKGHDCHGGTKVNAEETAKNDKAASGECCDKGICKCVGGTCHSGLSNILGNSGGSLAAVSSGANVFAFGNQRVDSALPDRLKRPPRA